MDKLPDSPPLPPYGVLYVHQVLGSLLYYAMAIDYTLIIALGYLESTQSQAIEDTLDKLVWLLNYVATHLDASITYVSSNVYLHTHIDASYLSVSNIRSRAGGSFRPK